MTEPHHRGRTVAALAGLCVVLAASVAVLGLLSEALPAWAFVCLVTVLAVGVVAALAWRRAKN